MAFPNKATQFQPGNPGGPGRPKKTPLTDAYRDKLGKLVPDDPEHRTYAQFLADVIFAKAVDGDIVAAKEIADRTEGKSIQRIESGEVAAPEVTYGLPDTAEGEVLN